MTDTRNRPDEQRPVAGGGSPSAAGAPQSAPSNPDGPPDSREESSAPVRAPESHGTRADAQPPDSGPDFIRLPRRQFVLALVCVILAMFLGSLAQTIVATALYPIVTELGGFDRYAWIATSYILAATAVAPIAGGLSDLYGRKPLFLAGLATFVAGSLLSGISDSMNELIAYRALQGIGGGIIMTCSLTAMADLIPPARRGRFQGLMAGVFGIASVIGPVAGGLIIELYSWQGIFLLMVPIALAILALFARAFPSARQQAHAAKSVPASTHALATPPDANVAGTRAVDSATAPAATAEAATSTEAAAVTRAASTGSVQSRPSHKLDYAGMALLVCTLVALLLALSLGGAQFAWDSREVLGLLTFGIVSTAAFIFVELRATQPIMPLQMYADRMMSSAMFIVFLTGFSLYGCLLFLPLFFQGVLGLSAAASGNLLFPMLPSLVVGAILSGQLLSRAGERYRPHMICGTALTALGVYLIATMSAETSVILIETYLALTGLGVGATLSTVTVAVQNSVPFKRVGAATAANQFWRSVGGMMGLAVAGAVMTASFSSQLTATLANETAAALPPEWMTSLQKSPERLLDPAAADSLRAGLAQAAPANAALTDGLIETLHSALGAALADVFVVLLVASALSLAAAPLFRVTPRGAGRRSRR